MPTLELNSELNNDENEELDLLTVTRSDLISCTKSSSSLSSSISISNDVPVPQLHSSAETTISPLDFVINNLDKSHSIINEKQKKKIRLQLNDTLEREYDKALDRNDLQQQIRASIGSLPGDQQYIPQIRFSREKSWFFSKLSSFRNGTKSDESGNHNLKLFDVYRFADKWDIILMIIGGIAALGVGVCYPIMFYLYQQIVSTLVSYNNEHTNSTVNVTNPCYIVSNNTITTSPSEAIKHIINYYVLLGFVTMLCSWIGWASWIVAAERQIRRIRYKLFRNMLRQEIGWFDLHNAGELNNRLVSDLDKMKEGMGEKVADFITLVGRLFGSLIYSLVIGWKLTLVYLSISPLIILSFNLTIKMIVKYTLEEVKAFSSASSIVQEVLQSIRTVTAFHGQDKEEKRFANDLIESKNIGIRKGIYVGLCQSFGTIVNYAGFALIVWYGPYLARTECSDYSSGTVLGVFFGSTTATMCIAQLIPNIQNFAEAAASGLHIFDIMERQTKIDASNDEGDKPETITGHIEFRNVTFGYPSREEVSVLSNLSLKIPSGKTVALVGSSGCGKSTIIQLIQRFYDPDHGQIFLDGRNLTKLNVAWLRTHIGIVSQEPVLFTGSIEDNIRFGKSDATDEEVQNAAKMANAHEFIMALPENYKTTSGDKLSGGQKQRVAIARALISNPKILLLDEATSALDNTSERVVQDALEKAKQGRTTIVIAHRLSTIRNADLIIGLDHGEVVENGSHNELMRKKGLYYELVMSQTHKDKEKDESDSESEEEEEEDDKVEQSLMSRKSVDRRVSKISILSAGSDEFDENANEIDLAGLSKKKKWFRTPFICKILKYNAAEWYWILLGTLVSLVMGSSSPLYGLIFGNMFSVFGDANVADQERETRKYAALGFSIGLVSGIAQFLTSYSFAKSGEALTMRMRTIIFSAILRQEISYFDHESNSTGALVTRLSSDASALKGLTGVRIGIILQSISAAALGLIIGFITTWKLTLVVLCFSPVLLLSTKISAQKGSPEKKSKDKNSFIEQGGQHATQAIEHIRTVAALHQENHFIELYEHAFNQEYKRQTRLAHLTALGFGLSNSSIYFLQCACFGYGSKLIGNGEITYSQLYKVYSVVSLTIFSVGRCIAIIPDYSKAKTAALRIMKLNKRESKINPHDESGIILDDVVGNIEFLDVNFRYANRPTLRILRHFTLKCASGQTTALVGPSGSGKSTTIALLQRFYDARTGKILLDGHDIKVLNIKWLRSLMGVVQQEPVLFNLSVRDNIAYGDNSREIPQDEIEMAARKANIHDLIISLPQGYETLCGSKGSQLSGGQKQRIAIARALIRNPKILLLDEATSALDNKSERVVQDALDQARTGRTCLTIAHRLTTIQNSEKIAVVNRGKMTEEGTHEQLLRQNGTYAKLALAQERIINH